MPVHTLLQMSLSAGLMALLLALLRRPLLRRLNGRAAPWLWAPVLLRLLVPGRIALLPARQAPRLTAMMAGQAVRPMATQTAAMPDAPAAAGASGMDAAASGMSLPGLIWLIGAGLTALFFIAQALWWRWRLSDGRACPAPDTAAWRAVQPIRRPVRVLVSARVPVPMTCGLLRPRIYLPASLHPSARPYVLLHEGTHILRLDAAAKGLLLLALCVHWFNPAVWLMAALLPRDLEIACDAQLLRRLGGAHTQGYARMLVRMASGRGPALASGFARHPVEERIVTMLKPNTQRTGALALLLVALMGVGLFAGAQEVQAPATLARTTVIGPLDALPGDAADLSIGSTDVLLQYYDMDQAQIAALFAGRGHPILLPLSATLPGGFAPNGSALTYLYAELPEGVATPDRPPDATEEEDGLRIETWALPAEVMTDNFTSAMLRYQGTGPAFAYITLQISLTALEDAYPSRSMLSWIGRLDSGLVLVAEQVDALQRPVAVAVPEDAYLAYQRGERGQVTEVYRAAGQGAADMDTLTALLAGLKPV